jgi:hypothetical protein
MSTSSSGCSAHSATPIPYAAAPAAPTARHMPPPTARWDVVESARALAILNRRGSCSGNTPARGDRGWGNAWRGGSGQGLQGETATFPAPPPLLGRNGKRAGGRQLLRRRTYPLPANMRATAARRRCDSRQESGRLHVTKYGRSLSGTVPPNDPALEPFDETLRGPPRESKKRDFSKKPKKTAGLVNLKSERLTKTGRSGQHHHRPSITRAAGS